MVLSERREVQANGIGRGNSGNACGDDATLIDDQGGGCLQDAVARGKVCSIREVDIDVLNAIALCGKFAEQAANAGATSAHVGGELHQRSGGGKPFNRKIDGVDSSGVVGENSDPTIARAQEHADAQRPPR